MADLSVPADVEQIDVAIVGAGISGIGAAYYLQTRLPSMSYAILEARAAIGGTWDLFRYPGIRSDSDLHTFGYEFRPWREENSIASGESILAYLRGTTTDNGINRHVRLDHRVIAASWSSEQARWLVEVEHGDVEHGGTGTRSYLSARWIFCATGYYRYDEGYTPRFEGRERFRGTIVHPQHWPEDLDYAGKRVVVIGSGATAVTLIPAMADTAEHVTMLQRTPTYVLPLPARDPVTVRLRELLGPERGYRAARWWSATRHATFWKFSQRFPAAARRFIRSENVKHLPDGFPVDEHFNPPYNPWQQRLCVAPDGDFFDTLSSGKASVATGRISSFTETGILLESGEQLEADIIVTATGLNLLPFGGASLHVDGTAVHLPETVAFKGMMLSSVPNFAFAIGYTNASWTLKVGLLCEHFCRLLAHMQEHGYDTCVPVLPDPDMATRPLLDFGAGYIQRSLDQLPKQGASAPWLMSMDYRADIKVLRNGPVEDDNLRFSTTSHTAEAERTAHVESASDPDDRFCVLPDGIRICYRTDGDPAGEPLVLIAGLGLDLTSWSPALVDALVERGHYVIRLDNRDAGRSSHMFNRAPGRLRKLAARPPRDAYDLGAMADDTVGLLDHLGVDSAHLVGMSLGGMIAQTAAARHPARARTLTSIFSTTGNPKVGRPAPSTMLRMAKAPARTSDQAVARHISFLRHIASAQFPFDDGAERAYAARAWTRGGADAAARGSRQIGAIQVSGDRTPDLRRITAPTLVIHGDHDLLVHPSGGRATAEAIPGARMVTVPSMRHHLAPGLLDHIVELIAKHTAADRTKESV